MASSKSINIHLKLNSTKIKDRNEGIEELDQIIDQGIQFTNKEIIDLTGSLFEVINQEKKSYLKSNSPASFTRLKSSSYILRKLITDASKKMKPTQMLCVLDFIKMRFLDHDQVFTPIAIDLSRMLYSIVSNEGHKNFILSQNDISFIDMIIKVLNQHFKHSTSESYSIDLLQTLKLLLRDSFISLNKIVSSLSHLICDYFDGLSKENSTTQHVLELANQSLVLLSTVDVSFGLKIVRSVMKKLNQFMSTNYEHLKEQYLIFNILSSEYISNKIPLLINEQEFDVPVLNFEFKLYLSSWISSLMQNQLKLSEESLEIGMIEFHNAINTNINWVSFHTISLKDKIHIIRWINVYGIVSLLNSHFQLQAVQDENHDQLWKRRRSDSSSYENLIHSSESSVELYLRMLKSQSNSTKRLGLKLLAFHLNLFEINPKSLSIKDVMLYDQPSLAPWVSLCVKLLLEYGWEATTQELSQILRISIQMLKEVESVSIGCQTIIQVLSCPNFVLNDRSLVQLVESTFDPSEVNGPVILNNDAMKFWIMFSELGKSFSFTEKKAGDKVLDWAISKWDSIPFGVDLHVLPEFIGWLSGSLFQDSNRFNKFDTTYTRFYAKWKLTSSLSRFILNSNINTPTIKVLTIWPQATPSVDFYGLERLLDKFLNKLASFDDEDNVISLARYIGYGLLLIQKISDVEQLDSSAKKIKHEVKRLSEHLKPRSKAEQIQLISIISGFKVINSHGIFLTDLIQLDELTNVVDRQSQEPSVPPDDFSDFGAVRKVSEQELEYTSISYSDLSCFETMDQKYLNLVIQINTDFGYSKSVNSAFDQALMYLQTLKSDRFCYGLYELIEYLETVKLTNAQSTTIKKLIREFGTKMLTDYKFNRSPVVLALISRFSLMCSNVLLTKAKEDILADFIDIQAWFLEFAKKRQLTEEFSISLFSRSLLQLLVYVGELDNTDPQEMYLTTLDILKNGTNFMRVYVSEHAEKYINLLPWKNKITFFDEFVSNFKSPQLHNETSASLLLCLSHLSKYSYPYFMKSICTILVNSNYHHFRPYALHSIRTILNYRRIGSLKEISSTSRLDLLSFWYNTFNSFDSFPYDLFEYSSLKEFVKDKVLLLYSIVDSKDVDGHAALKSILSLSERDRDDLQLESMSWLLPLAYTPHGLRNVMLSYLDETLDRSLVECQSFLIIRNILTLIDVSDEKKYFQCIPGLDSLPLLEDLVPHDTIELYPLAHSGIKLADGIHQIIQLSNDVAFWSPSIVYFLVKSLLRNLLQSFDKDEKVLALRRLKLLLILGREGFQDEKIMMLVCKFLGNFLSDPDVHIDSALVILTILKIYPTDLSDSKLYPGSMLNIYHNLSKYHDSGNEIFQPLNSFLLDLYSKINHQNPWKLLFTPFIDTIRGNGIRLDLPLLHDSLRYASQAQKVDMKKNLVNVMEVLFTKKPEASLIPPGFKTDSQVAKFLRGISKLEPRKSVMVFISRYLGRYYLETGDDLENLPVEFENGIEYIIDTSSKSLNTVFNTLVLSNYASEDLNNQIIIDDLLGHVLHCYNKNPLSVDKLINFEDILSDCAHYLLPLDKLMFKVLHPATKLVASIGDLVSDAGESMCSVVEWCQNLSISILFELKSLSPVIFTLIIYLSALPEVSVKIVNHIWLFYARSFKEAQQFLARFINNVLKSENHIPNSIEKLKVVLELCHLVRAASKEDLKPFVTIYKKLDAARLYKRASEAGLNKFSLLILEEYSIKNGMIEKDELDSQSLTAIYEDLDDLDLLYGVPVDPSLDYAMNILNKASLNTPKSVMFNSAKFDSSIIFENSLSAKGKLLNSLSKSGLDGLSSLVNDYMDPLEKLNNSYDWHWKLNKWDIPLPSKISTESEMLYTLLKSVKDQVPQNALEFLCQDSMVRMAELSPRNIMRSLCILYSIETLISFPYLDLNSNIVDFNCSTDSWFPFASFNSFENLLLSRRIMFENLSSRIGLDESLLATSHELSRYITLSRLHSEHQRSVNSTVILDNIVKSLEESPLKSFLGRLSSYESASTLWGLGETVIPIAMVENNLKKEAGYGNAIFPLHYVHLSDSVLNSVLVKWNSESRQKKFEQTMTDHVEIALKQIDKVTKPRERAEIYHTIGYFCYKQVKTPGGDEEIKRRELFLSSKRTELNDLKSIIRNPDTTERDKKDAKRFYQRIQLQYETDNESYKSLVNNRDTCIEKAIEMFLRTISTDDLFDDQDVDKFSALWLEYSAESFVNNVVEENIFNVPSHKFIPWINQLVSRLAFESSDFQKSLQSVLAKICFKHPYHSLYYIMNLRAQKLYEISKNDKTVGSRTKAADMLWRSMYKQEPNFQTRILSPIEDLSMSSINLALEKVNNKERKILLENLKNGDFWVKTLPTLNIPLPTMNNPPISLDGNYDSLPRIKSVDPIVFISSSGISLPKIMKVYLNDGSVNKLLLKGGSDDLRQDAIMEQVFEKVNLILQKDKETRKRNLKIRTYKVVPLGPTSGIIEFVSDSIALSDILRPLHRKDPISFDEARQIMKAAQSKSNKDRVSAYSKITDSVAPVFRNFFYETFLNVDNWYKSRQIYTKGIATTSIIGYVLGLGDRHLNNILIDKKTGEPIHIDLGVAFDQGTLLPVPETVPFRLTRDVVDGLGVTGVKGSFEKGSEHVLRVMKENVEKIISILDVLKYDPLYSWAISPIRKKKLQDVDDSSKFKIEDDVSDAGRAVKGVEDKLKNNDLSVEATMQQLIQEATDPKRLAVIYLGWTPFY